MIKAKAVKVGDTVVISFEDGQLIEVERGQILFGILEGDIVFCSKIGDEFKFREALKREVNAGEPHFMDKRYPERVNESSVISMKKYFGDSDKEVAKITHKAKVSELMTWGGVIVGLGSIAVIVFFVISSIFGTSDEKELKRNQSNNTVSCQKMLKRYLNYPNTFDQHWGGIKYRNYGGLNYMIDLNFSAKNAFGVESDFSGTCEVVNGTINSAKLN